MKTQDSGDSFDSDDIDLDEIAKMIDPLDDLEKNLFSLKPAENTTRTARISPPKKVEKLEERGNDETEVLTSFSSNNERGKSEDVGKSLSKNLERDTAIDSVGKFNAPARARRRNAKFGSEHEGVASSNAADSEFLASSNLETGLWSGDDLWRLNEEKVLDPQETSKASLTPGLKSPLRESKGKTAPNSTKAKGNNKPGKFDWLGLLDDDSEEEKDRDGSAGNKDQKAPIVIDSSAPKDIVRYQDKLERIDLNQSRVEKEFSSVSKEAKMHENIPEMEPKGVLIKNSFSESLSLKKGGMKSSESEHIGLSKLESKSVRSQKVVKDEGRAAKISEVLRSDENDHLHAKDLFNEGTGRTNPKNAGGEEKDRTEGQPDVTALPRKKSPPIEDERSSRGYAPTFLGGSPERPGRRRRREGAEGLPSRPAINPNFDPLGLFSVDDDSSKMEDTSKSKAPLPDWLTGSSKKISTEIENKSEAVKESKKEESVKEKERRKDLESQGGSYSEKSKEVDSQLSKYSIKMSSEANEMIHEVLDSKDFITKDDEQKLNESSRKDVPPSLHVSHRKESEQDSKNLSRSTSDESHNESPSHSASVASTKGKFVNINIISEMDAVSPKSKEKIPGRRKEIKDDQKSSKKQHLKTSTKLKAKKRELPRVRVSNEDTNLSSPSERTDFQNGNAKELALLERQYGRKVRELEEQADRAEQLEEELAKMRFLEGEVEHLKAVVHVLELEKSAAEALVESLQTRHSEQLKRLEDVHRNEVETLRKALLREEKRGAEEVKRLVEDHRKTLDRLMDANIRLEEEFRARMLEARRDWSRDVEAMRMAYQQSNNAAITNASLAVLTGHSFGVETKDKGEDDIKDESSAKAVSQCPQEVKDLSHTVERVESILTQALEVMLPKAKPQNEGVPTVETDRKVQGDGHDVNSIRKHQGKSLRAKGKPRLARSQAGSKKVKSKVDKREKVYEPSGSSEEEEESTEEQNHEISSGDEVEKSERSETDDKIRRQVPPKEQQRKKGFCCDCKCCHGHMKGLQWHLDRSVSVEDSYVHRDKYDKEGHNMKFRHRDNGEHWRNRKKIFSWKDQLDHEDIYQWNKEDRHIQHPEQDHFTLGVGPVLDGNYIYMSSQSNAIIDPKAYLLQLASANISNLFQSSVVTSA